MEAPRLGVKLELQLPAYATATATWEPSRVGHLHHMEVPKLGVKLELQLPAYAIATWDSSHVSNLHHSSQQYQILNPLSKASD